MNFIEYLTEDKKKDLYILVDKDTMEPATIDDDTLETWAPSEDKAKHQILHRLRTSGIALAWKIINNREQFICISYDKYKSYKQEMEQQQYNRPPTEVKRQQPTQLTLFDDPNITTPY
jgi:hypothetical protein